MRRQVTLIAIMFHACATARIRPTALALRITYP